MLLADDAGGVDLDEVELASGVKNRRYPVLPVRKSYLGVMSLDRSVHMTDPSKRNANRAAFHTAG